MSCLSHTAQKCPRLVKIKGKEKAVSAFSAIFVRRKPGITNDLLLTSILKDRGEFILLFTMITDYDCTHTLQCVQGYNREANFVLDRVACLKALGKRNMVVSSQSRFAT